jgi:hypothetical protein
MEVENDFLLSGGETAVRPGIIAVALSPKIRALAGLVGLKSVQICESQPVFIHGWRLR